MKDIVAKVGGSLYDLPDLSPRLRAWLAGVQGARVLLVPGGGPTVDAIRRLDAVHTLGEEASHWLALQALSVNAHFLASLLPDVPVVETPHTSPFSVAVLSPWPFLRDDEGRAGCLPHHWDVTSDSVAARAAVLLGATELVLLKSVTIPLPPDGDWRDASCRGWIDGYFPQVVCQRPELRVRAVNLREWNGVAE
jgi:aspartokinase-like uncharacterized kinase